MQLISDACIHIQTIPTHFFYVFKLLDSINKFGNNSNATKIFIVFDSKFDKEIFYKEINLFDKNLLNVLDIELISMETILSNSRLFIGETIENVLNPKNVLGVSWGAGGHRDYVALKRTYSLLEIRNRGFSFAWCLDSESLFLKEFDVKKFILENQKKQSLLIGSGSNGVRYPFLFKQLFNWEINKLDPINYINIRMNDFWFINLDIFYDLINYLQKVHSQPLSFFINGSEQSLYEYFIYKGFKEKKYNIELIKIIGDLHNNNLFKNYLGQKKLDLNLFSEVMNDIYFNKTLSYRGDYINELKKSKLGLELFKKLNIKVAVSNFQGN